MKKKSLWRKALSLLLAGTVVMGSIHPTWAQEIQTEESPQSAFSDSQEIALKFEGNLDDASANHVSVTSSKEASYTEGISGQALSWIWVQAGRCSRRK